MSQSLLSESYLYLRKSLQERLLNLSTRSNVGTGANILIAGFVVTGNTTENILVRGVGPALSLFGVTGYLTDTKIEVYDSAGNMVASNDNWDASLTATFSKVGAYQIPANSKDSALLVNLKPGSYTVQLSGVNGQVGEGLLELYEIQ